MSKKILIALVVVVIVAGAIGINYAQSFKTATIDIKREGVSVTIVSGNKKEVKKIPEGVAVTQVKLSKGSYSVIPEGPNIDSKPLTLIVSDAGGNIVVDPGYSKDYLQNILKDEGASIKSALATTYPGAIDSFTINTGKLYSYGDWYSTTLVQQSPGPGSNGDVYRTILHKERGAWNVATTPAIVLSAKEYPSIPRTIIDEINAETGY